MIIKHPRLIIQQHGTIKNYRYVGDVSYAPIRRVAYMYFYYIAQTKKESFLDDQINLSLIGS